MTADHGGKGRGQPHPHRLADYRIPFLVWGPEAPGGEDLYLLNPTYGDPGRTRPWVHHPPPARAQRRHRQPGPRRARLRPDPGGASSTTPRTSRSSRPPTTLAPSGIRLLAVRRDRRAGFEDFVAARRPHLRRLAYALCGDWHTAEDLVQTALAKLYVAWPRVATKGAEDADRPAHLVKRLASTRRASRPSVRSPAWESVRRGLRGRVDPSTRPALVEALAQLPGDATQDGRAQALAGPSVTETAAELDIGEGTVKSHTSRASGAARPS